MNNLNELLSREYWIQYLELAKEGGLTDGAIANDIITGIEKAINYSRCCETLPSKETIISEAVKYQNEWMDDPHSIADEAFIEGCNFILTSLRKEKVIR